MIRLLLLIGLVRLKTDGSIRWPFRVSPLWIWKIHFVNHGWRRGHNPIVGGWFRVFRNNPGVVKYEPGRILPRRWGFRVLGVEFGDRG